MSGDGVVAHNRRTYFAENVDPTRTHLNVEYCYTPIENAYHQLMRSYMARKCDIHFPLERKLSRFLTASMRVYRVPEEEQAKVLAFIQSLDVKAIATEAMYKLFTMLEMKYDFKLSKNGEMEETR